MAPEPNDLDGSDGTAPTVRGRLRSTVTELPAVSSFPSAKLTRLLSRLSGEIHELERLVVGEGGTSGERDLSVALEPSREGPPSELLSSPGVETPVRERPEASTEWGALAYHHVGQARMALEDGDKATFWREFYAARRMELFGLEELGEEYLEMEAQNIKLEAAGLAARDGLLRLDQPRTEAIQNILRDVGDYEEPSATGKAPDTEQASQITANRVGAAMHVLHEFYVDQRLTGRILEIHLRSFVVIMALSAVTFILAFLSIPLREGQGIFDRVALLQSPLSGLVGLPTFAQLIVLVLIVVLGIMGASVSGILSLSRELRQSRIPEQAGTVWFAVARLATGGVAALMLFLFLISGLVSLGDAATGLLTLNLGTDLSVALVFSLSFVAGFSERLLVRVVKSVAGEDGDAARPGGTWY